MLICLQIGFSELLNHETVLFMSRSRCQKCQNVKTLKTELKANGAIFSKTDACTKLRKHLRNMQVAQICATCANLFKKSDIFLQPFAFTVHGNNLGKLFQKRV